MSVTRTANPMTSTVAQVLTDYDLHHSGSEDTTPANPNPRDSPSSTTENPEGWPTDHRRVPPYRPTDRNLSFEERPNGLNTMETIFITTMLNGVGLNANLNAFWRATGGKISNTVFRYQIGGEW